MKIFSVAKKHDALVSLHRHRGTASTTADFNRHIGRTAVRQILRGPSLQPTLVTGAASDVYEQEADSVAGKIMQATKPMIQRSENPDAPHEALSTPDESAPGRAPKPNELSDIGVHDHNFPNLTAYRILVERTYGFNCFAWAVGIDDRIITSRTISELKYSTNLEGWTRYLMDHHGFARYANGGDTSADLVLFGEQEGAVGHAARKAAQPYGRMTFSSKLGERSKTPVILHALSDLEGGTYGNALRSFWKAPASEEQKTGEQTQPAPAESVTPLLRKTTENGTEEEPVSRHMPDHNFSAAPPQTGGQIAAMQGSGRPLPISERAFFEPRLGRDFGQVRIHTGQTAAQAAKAINARAFTLGKDIFFGSGQFSADSSEGRRLLAHELTHVVQQSEGNGPSGRLQRAPVFPDGSCGGEKIETKITEYAGIALELVTNALRALENPEAIAGPLRRFFSIAPTDSAHLFLLKENLTALQKKLESPVDSYCRTASDLRRSGHQSPPRAYTEIDPETGRVIPEAGITYNRNIFRITGTTTRRQIINTVIHEYTHLVGIGHGETDPEDPIDNKSSIKVRGLTWDEAFNSAEVYMRFIQALN
ncbi:MAG: DUF4157 domain-containing protein [Desulfobacterales bacterium]|nr:DUF4157 domain-containing protein [Desulfobacterales bacterium]MDJ0887011.1 DUF4157 domain-containing protein [Desulfobacterales bacterium]MDJ0989226.1 DUF4157 domain-containing protein [Desulfobacterales bacterium]